MKLKETIKDLGPNFYMLIIWILTNIFLLIVLIVLITNLTKKVDFFQQQDLPNQSQTQQYKKDDSYFLGGLK